MNRTYKIREDLTLKYKGRTLYRIEALVDIPSAEVVAGDIGGYVESYDNLQDTAWVFDDAKVYANAQVYDNARVYCKAEICYDAEVHDNAIVHGDAKIGDNAIVYDEAKVRDHARVYGNSKVCGCADVYGEAKVYDNAQVYDNARVYGKAEICDDARIAQADSDYIVFKNWWSSGRYFTWTRSNNMWKVGCFYGTGEELTEKAYKDSKVSGDNYKAIVDYVNNVVIPQADKNKE